MSQYARPAGATPENWYESVGNTQTNIYTTIDEEVRADGDYIYSTPDGSPDTNPCVIDLSAVTDPSVHTGHVVRYTYLRSKTNKDLTLVVRLVDPSYGVVASWTHVNPSDAFALAQQSLTTTQAGYITDYANLTLEFEVTVNQAGGGHAEVSWAELEVPGGTTLNGEITLQGQSSLTAAASVTHQVLDGAILLEGESALTVAASVGAILDGAIVLEGESSLTVVASVTHAILDGAIALDGESTLTVSASVISVVDGAIAFAGQSFLGTIRP